jgi:hypothetical protein
MIATDEDALICDLAETYHIYNYRGLPVQTLAALSVGLRDNARIKMKMAGFRVDTTTMLLASIADSLHILVWQNTENGHNGVHIPPSIFNQITGADDQSQSQNESFDTPEDFRSRWNELAGEEK